LANLKWMGKDYAEAALNKAISVAASKNVGVKL
jgi:hypothetical protein